MQNRLLIVRKPGGERQKFGAPILVPPIELFKHALFVERHWLLASVAAVGCRDYCFRTEKNPGVNAEVDGRLNSKMPNVCLAKVGDLADEPDRRLAGPGLRYAVFVVVD